MKTTHDHIRESIEEKLPSPRSTTTEGKAQDKELSDPKKVSSGPFPGSEARKENKDQPRLSGLPSVQGWMCGAGCQNAQSRKDADIHIVSRQDAKDRISRMAEEDREQYHGLIKWLREDTAKALEHMIRYDAGISLQGTDTLMAALIAIQTADAPNLPGVCINHDIRLDTIELLSVIFEHDHTLSPFERSDIETVITALDRAVKRQVSDDGN